MIDPNDWDMLMVSSEPTTSWLSALIIGPWLLANKKQNLDCKCMAQRLEGLQCPQRLLEKPVGSNHTFEKNKQN